MRQNIRRLFFALWPDEDVRQQIAARVQRLAIRTGRLVAYHNWHLTLVFLGNVEADDNQALFAAAARVKASGFSLRLDRSGCWPDAGVFWLAPAAPPDALPDGLSELHGKLDGRVQVCGLPVARRPYRPHVTLARKLPMPRPAERFAPILWKVKDFRLLESVSGAAGPRYDTLGIWPLSS